MNEERAILIEDDAQVSYFDKERDCLLTAPGIGHIFIKDCVEGDLTSGKILIIRPTQERVPNTEEEVNMYWEIVREGE